MRAASKRLTVMSSWQPVVHDPPQNGKIFAATAAARSICSNPVAF